MPDTRLLATFRPTTADLPPGTVMIDRPLRNDEADLRETGPMFRVTYLAGGRTADAFLDELTSLSGPVEWGDWWDAEDHESLAASQHYIETGERQTRRVTWEHSMAYAARRRAVSA